MNRRQAKKQYKKLYGCNPPKPTTTVNAESNLKNIITRIHELLLKTTRHLIWKISNMSQEEFDCLLKDLTAEHKKLAVELRNKCREE